MYTIMGSSEQLLFRNKVLALQWILLSRHQLNGGQQSKDFRDDLGREENKKRADFFNPRCPYSGAYCNSGSVIFKKKMQQNWQKNNKDRELWKSFHVRDKEIYIFNMFRLEKR